MAAIGRNITLRICGVAMIFRISDKFSPYFNFGHVVYEARDIAEDFLYHKLGAILEVSIFTFTDDKPETVFNKIASECTAYHNGKAPVLVEPWTPWNPWTSAIATTKSNAPGVIFINTRKINQRSAKEYAATFLHEFCHIVGYGHGDNFNQDKEPKLSSVPIKLASMVMNG